MRTAVAATVLSLAVIVVVVYRRTETIPPQSPVVGHVERQMKREMRRGWLRVLLVQRTLEVRVNGEAVLGYSSRAPRLEEVDTNVVRGIAKRAVDLYAPARFGPPPGIDRVRIRLRHAHMFGPIAYRVAGRDYNFSPAQLGR